MKPENWSGDKGYMGINMITAFRKPAGGELLDWQRVYDSAAIEIRWMVEPGISHWKILYHHTRRLPAPA